MIHDPFPYRIVGPRFGRFAALGLVLLAIEAPPAFGQSERYELGRRLREFEIEWDRVEDARARALASQSLKAAVKAYFAFRLDDAGRAISEARFALRGEVQPFEGERWAESLCFKPEARLIDATRPSFPVIVASFYAIEARKPEDATARLVLGGGSTPSRAEVLVGPLPMTVSLPLKGLSAGDHALIAEIRAGDRTLARSSQTISLADRLADRLGALRKTIDGWPTDLASASMDRESARGQLRILESLAAKMTPESDLPADRILAGLEAQAIAVDRSLPYLGKHRAGQAWVTIVTRTGRRVAAESSCPSPPPGENPCRWWSRSTAPAAARTCSSRATAMARSFTDAASAAGSWSPRAAMRSPARPWRRWWTSWPGSIRLTAIA